MMYILKTNHRANSTRPPGSIRGVGGKNHGFTLVSAIFLMVVLVVLGASLVTLGSVQHITSAQQLQAVRAYYAARAGVEWAAARVAAGGCPAGSSTVVEGASTTLNDFTVTVTCTNVIHTLGGAARTYTVVNATATRGSYDSPDYVSRRVQSKVLQDAPP